MRYGKYNNGRYWALYDEYSQLIGVFVYKRGVIGTMKVILQTQGFGDESISEILQEAEIAYKATRKKGRSKTSMWQKQIEIVLLDELAY